MFAFAGATLIAFLIGVFVTAAELVTGEFSQTFFLIKNSRSFRLYVLLYGLLTASAFALFRQVLPTGTTAAGLALSSVWTQAVIIGATGKSFFNINVFSTPKTSFGLEAITRLFQPGLLRQMKIDEWRELNEYVLPRTLKYTDLNAVKTKAKDSVPPSLPSDERQAFEVDVNDAADIKTVMLRLLKFAGRATFDSTFS
jgi:hypothetical protein